MKLVLYSKVVALISAYLASIIYLLSSHRWWNQFVRFVSGLSAMQSAT